MTEMNDLSPENIELIRILGAVDSLFGEWPSSRDHNATCFAINERQLAYTQGQGLRWTVGGGAEQRKVGERLLAELSDAGMVILPKSDGKHRCVGLSPLGDDYARSLLGFARVAETWPLFVAFAEVVERGPGRWASAATIASWIGESDPRLGWPMLYPLLSRGYLEAGASSVGETVFTVMKTCLELADNDVPALLADPKPDQRFNDEVYWPAHDAAELDKATWQPSRPNCVYCSILN